MMSSASCTAHEPGVEVERRFHCRQTFLFENSSHVFVGPEVFLSHPLFVSLRLHELFKRMPTAVTLPYQGFTPNMSFIVRDKAHGSRRILSRPWACDDYLNTVASSLITDPSSIAQLIQHSEDLKAMYSEATKKSSCKYVATSFTNMRAAKHRFESMCTPLSRICLDWEAVISFLVRVAIERGSADRAGLFATSCLDALSDELMLTAAMLADAADECMILIRFFDHREVDNAKVCSEVKSFVDRISTLFFEDRQWPLCVTGRFLWIRPGAGHSE